MLNIIETFLGQCPILKSAISTLRNQSYLPVILCSLFGEHLDIHTDSTFIYTDGSKSNDAAGCATNIGQSEYSAKLSNLSFSYKAELIAILLVKMKMLTKLLNQQLQEMKWILNQSHIWIQILFQKIYS